MSVWLKVENSRRRTRSQRQNHRTQQ